MKKIKLTFLPIIASIALMIFGAELFGKTDLPATGAKVGTPFYVILALNQEDSKVPEAKAREELNKLVFLFDKFITEEPNSVTINDIVQIGNVGKDSQIWMFYEEANAAHALFGSSAWIEGGVGETLPLLGNTKLKDTFEVKVKRSIQKKDNGQIFILFTISVAVLK